MKYSIYFLILFSIIFQQLGQAQYEFKRSTEITLPSISLGLLTAGYIVGKRNSPITEAEILQLDRNMINKLDRGVTNNWNPKVAKASDAFLYGSIASPLLFLAGKNTRQDFLKTTVISTEVFVLNSGLTYLAKSLVDRKRPYLYNPDVDMMKKLKRDASNSFFSGHTSTVAAMGYSFAFMYTNYFPDSKGKPVIWTVAAGLPALTALFRVKAGKHFWTDVLVGYAVGAFTGWLVPYLHEL